MLTKMVELVSSFKRVIRDGKKMLFYFKRASKRLRDSGWVQVKPFR